MLGSVINPFAERCGSMMRSLPVWISPALVLRVQRYWPFMVGNGERSSYDGADESVPHAAAKHAVTSRTIKRLNVFITVASSITAMSTSVWVWRARWLFQTRCWASHLKQSQLQIERQDAYQQQSMLRCMQPASNGSALE
jgi:hypothetical protein